MNFTPVIARSKATKPSITTLWIASLAFAMTMGGMASVSLAAPATIDFTVTMSEAANVTGCPANCPRIAVTVDGQTRYAEYSAGTGSSSLTFSYAPTIGDLDLDGVTLTSPIDLNGGTITDLNGNAITDLAYTAPDTSGIKIDYPSLSMDFITDADGRYTINGTAYNDLSSFLGAAGGSFTRASTATYFDSTGTLQTAASGEPRFDHDPITHAPKGILIEESRTNKLLFSQQIETSTTKWAVSNTTLTLSAIPSPIQSTMAYSVNENTNNTTHYFQSGTYTLSDTNNTISAFVKTNGRSSIGFKTNANGITTNCIFDLSTGTVSSLGTYLSATITPINNGWWRLSATFNPSAGSGVSTWVGIQLYDDSNNSVYAGDPTKGIYATGFQWEHGSFPTSYISTTGAAVTRQADMLTMPTGGWHDSARGTMFAQASIPHMGGANSPRTASLDDATNNNRINLLINDGGADQSYAQIYNLGTNLFNSIIGTYTQNTNFKQGIAYANNNTILCSSMGFWVHWMSL